MNSSDRVVSPESVSIHLNSFGENNQNNFTSLISSLVRFFALIS